jgi:hypothetical protein
MEQQDWDESPNSLQNSRRAITKLSPFLHNAFKTKARRAAVHGSVATKTL